MSRAKAKADRVEHDYYPTPAWCVERILDNCQFLRESLEPDAFGRNSTWLEPCAGEGHIVHAVGDWVTSRQALLYPQVCKPNWILHEIRPECEPFLEALQPQQLTISSYLTYTRAVKFDVGFTNPPFTYWQEFRWRMTQECRIVALLLRLDVLGSDARRKFWQSQDSDCDIYVMADRPSFTNDGGTDSGYYAWFIWHKNADRRWRVI